MSGRAGFVKLQKPCDTIPDTISRPETGIVMPNIRAGGQGRLTVQNFTNTDGVVILTLMDEQPAMAAYIRAGGSFTVDGIQDGEYLLFFSTGADWFGEGRAFLRNPRRMRFDESFPFSTTSWSSTIWTATLHAVRDGNASTSPVSPDRFPPIGP